MTSAPALPPVRITAADLARDCGKAWPPFHRLDLGPDKSARHAARNAGWRQCGEVIEFPQTFADQHISENRI